MIYNLELVERSKWLVYIAIQIKLEVLFTLRLTNTHVKHIIFT